MRLLLFCRVCIMLSVKSITFSPMFIIMAGTKKACLYGTLLYAILILS